MAEPAERPDIDRRADATYAEAARDRLEARAEAAERERDANFGAMMSAKERAEAAEARVAELEAALRKAWDHLEELAGLVEDGGRA